MAKAPHITTAHNNNYVRGVGEAAKDFKVNYTVMRKPLPPPVYPPSPSGCSTSPSGKSSSSWGYSSSGSENSILGSENSIAVYIGTINIISIYPNPGSEYIHYTVGSEAGGTVTVKLYDALGREVYNKEETIEAGVTEKKLSTAALSNGNYLLRITNSNLERTQKQFVIK